MNDLLNMDYINSLPQPLLMRFYGDKDTWWEVESIDVETGCLRILVCGLLQVSHIGEVAAFKDLNDVEYDPDTLYNESEMVG